MIRELHDLSDGYHVEADVVVIGSGAGGAVAAANLAAAGLDTVVIEAGPVVRPTDMTRDAPSFMARHYWEGGLQMVQGSGTFPSMAGRCLGGSTVINSAIMFRLPEWVRQDWIATDGLDELSTPALDAAYDRVLTAVGTAPTAPEAMGRRNLLTGEILAEAGLDPKPLPRAVQGCKASGDCLTGCASGAKQSVDKVFLARAVEDGARVYTCSEVDRVTHERGRATGVTGRVVDPDGRRTVARFTVRAPRVVVSAGTLHTPAILLRSGLKGGGGVGATFQAHISGFALGVMDQPVHPWVGATQGMGAFSDRVQGMKFEALWAPAALIASQWLGVGPAMYRLLPDMARALMIPLVYRAGVTGRVVLRPDGGPQAFLTIPRREVRVVLSEVHRIVEAMLRLDADYVFTGVKGVPREIRSTRDAEALRSTTIRPRHLKMTCNHTFGSVRMSADPRRGPVTPHGRLRGVDGVWVADASLFPSPSAVNPQGTVMALSDLISRRIGGRHAVS